MLSQTMYNSRYLIYKNKNTKCPIPGSVHGQAGRGLEQPGLVEGACGRALELDEL